MRPALPGAVTVARKRRSESGAGRKIPPAIWIPFFIALLAYLPTLGHGFVWDDVDFILENPAAHKLSSLSEALQHGYGWVPTETGEQTNPRYLYFRPVIVIANTVQWVLSGGAPWFFHLVNLLTHALTVALLAALALALGLSPITAALVGESAGWIRFAKGAVAAVRFDDLPAVAEGELRWLVTAKLLGC